MEGKIPKLWAEKDDDASRELRLPNASQSLKLSNEEMKPETKKFSLSADAPEWYPPNYQPPSPSNVSAVQDRRKKIREPEVQVEISMSNLRIHSNCDNDCDTGDSSDISRIKHIINTLTNDPGHFDHLVDLFMETLYPYFEDISMLYSVAEVLVHQAIEMQSFRYTAARICCVMEQSCPEFRASLHLRCKKELDTNANKQGVLLFVAELYTQLSHENIYGSYLIDAFKQLLSKGGNDNIKSICQALKLTGRSLELHDAQALDDVFVQLNNIKSSITCPTASSLLNSVINLRQNNWGQANVNDTPSHSAYEQENYPWTDSTRTVFYDSEGYKFTSEENEFLASNIQSSDEYLGGYESDPDDLCDPEPEMDEEIQAAFREFVKYSKR